MKTRKITVFFLVLLISVLVLPHWSDLEASGVKEPSGDSPLSGKSYLVINFYLGGITFDYYDFAEDGSFIIWTLEGYGEGSYSVRDDLLFQAQFHGALTESLEFAYQLRGIIFSEKVFFGDGVEYLGSSEGERYYFLGIYSGEMTSFSFVD